MCLLNEKQKNEKKIAKWARMRVFVLSQAFFTYFALQLFQKKKKKKTKFNFMLDEVNCPGIFQ